MEKNKGKQIQTFLMGIILPVLVIALWILSKNTMDIPDSLLPKISSVGTTFKEMIENGKLQADLGISLSRVVKGFLCAAVLGVILGAVMGMSETIKKLCLPTLTVIRQIPIIAWIPLIILWAGIGEESKVIIIILAAFFPIMVNTLSGFESTPESLVEVAKLYKLSYFKTFWRVYLPHAIEHILVGLKLGLGVSWMAVVAAEMIAAVSGIGYRMNDARNLMRSDIVIACMIVIGLVGILMDKLLSLSFRFLMPWKE